MNTLAQRLREQACAQTANSAETLEAALILIAFGRIPQALMLAHQSVEMAFKSYIGEREPETLSILGLLGKDDVKNKQFYEKLDAELIHQEEVSCDYDINENSGHLTAALEVMIRRYKSKVNRRKIGKLNTFRNQIVHQGGQGKFRTSDILKRIIEGGWEQLKLHYREQYQIDIGKHFFLGVRADEIDTEISNIIKYLGHAKKTGSPTENAHCVLTCLLQSNLVVGVGHSGFDNEGDLIDRSGEEFDLNQELFRIAEREWDGIIAHNFALCCKICGNNHVLIGVNPDETDWENRTCYPNRIFCRNCNLHITEDYAYLARLHFGEISDDNLDGRFEKAIPH